MEYAEDKATRYQKRFGKQSNTAESGEGQGNGEGQDPIQEAEHKPKPAPDACKVKATRRRPGGKYAEETVQRLTGAIVEGKGQRTLFE